MNNNNKVARILPLISLLALSPLHAKDNAPQETSTNPSPSRVVPVEAVTPTPLPETVPVRVTGRLEAVDELQLAFKTGGIVAAVNVDIGDSVKAGQVLARLDTTEVDAEVKRAEEAHLKALRDRERVESLRAQGVASQEAFDNARTAVGVAEAQLQAARFNQAHSTIVAPAQGRVLARFVKGREMVGAGAPVLVVSKERGGWLLRTSVSDRDAVRMQAGDAAVVSVDAWPEHKFTASVSRIAGMADPQTGAFEVELSVQAPPDVMLRSGMVARAVLQVRNAYKGVSLPVAALVDVQENNGTLFVIDGDVARLRSVKIAGMQQGALVVTAGLKAGERVVVAGAPYVNDGEKVRLVDGME